LKKKPRLLLLTSTFLLLGFSGCSLLGIHTQVTNSKHAGTYPKFSESTKLLGNVNTKYRSCFDATYYELNIQVDHQNKYLKGKIGMSAIALSEFDTLQIDLYANMKVNKIQMEVLSSEPGGNNNIQTTNRELSYYRKLGAIFITMPRHMKAGEKFKLLIDYEGMPVIAKKAPWDGGFVWKKDKQGNPWVGVACETEGASLWWPCKDVNNDEPDSASINLTVAKELTAVSNGHLIAKEENGNFTTYKWFVSYPINLYDITLYVGKFQLLADTLVMPSGKTLYINHYVNPMNFEKARTHLQQAKAQIAFYEKTFGEYPWYKDGYKLVESPYEGMEHQTAIAYGNGYSNGHFPFDYIILHESAHEWWGNAITASDFADVWLQEGFATYSEALYVESTQDKSAYLRYMLFYRLFIQNKWPVVGPSGYRYFYYKNADCYQKGAWTLHTLRTLINNDSIFFDIIKTYYDRNKLKTITSQDFINVVNEKTSDDYTWFFNQYLHKRETPFLEYYWDGVNFFYRWKYVDATFKMPAEISLDGLITITLKPTNQLQKIAIDKNTYKKISFNNYTELFGLKENKRLRKVNPQIPK
jgi:aminopeptidase N